MLPPPDFTVVLRGFDRSEVDALIEAVYRGEAHLAGRTVFDFTVVLRGYDREQVNAYLGRLAALHEAEGGFRPLADPDSGVPTVGPVALRDPAFPRAVLFGKGYDPAQVDALVARIAPVLAGGGGVSSDEVERASFPLVRKGYDVDRVDAYLKAVAIRLRAEGR
ncbi:DivIVA domain-containing protein [Catellatospora vulcania]|uniref:DivIVA domain-containing protein n=1 Tax=Catellatospora vulcania TaxID=1460450 RepID=UPI0012D377F3|nr:DivIVA domain-containing protein [Catellatospora vulcania]